MKNIYIAALAMMLLFSFAVSACITFHEFPLQDPEANVSTFMMLGGMATVVTFIVCLIISL